MEISHALRPNVFTMRVSDAEAKALVALAKAEGIPNKSLLVRRLIHQMIDQGKDKLPSDLIRELRAVPS